MPAIACRKLHSTAKLALHPAPGRALPHPQPGSQSCSRQVLRRTHRDRNPLVDMANTLNVPQQGGMGAELAAAGGDTHGWEGIWKAGLGQGEVRFAMLP